jgi:hypothetical protein
LEMIIGVDPLDKFLNTETRENSSRDPRIGETAGNWVETSTGKEAADLEKEEKVKFRNTVTNEVIDTYPHFRPEVLIGEGVRIETLTLL